MQLYRCIRMEKYDNGIIQEWRFILDQLPQAWEDVVAEVSSFEILENYGGEETGMAFIKAFVGEEVRYYIRTEYSPPEE